jgi:putative aldouronate transport system permease protein
MKKSAGDKIFEVSIMLVLLVIVLLCIFPLLHVFFASFSSPIEITRNKGLILWFKGSPTIQGYKLVFSTPTIIIGYTNTLFYVIVGTCINVFMTTIGAYVLSRKDFIWGKYIMIMVVVTMFFNGGLIPTYLLVKNLNMVNTRWAIIIPRAILVWNLIIMRTSFLNIPDSMVEVAYMEGANDFFILSKVIIPLSKTIMAVMFLFYAVDHWNSWFPAMIYLRKRNMYPLQIFLREILIDNSTSEMTNQQTTGVELSDLDFYRPLVKYTTIVIATVPILMLYPFLQKHFVKGVMIGSLKG